MDLSFCNDLMDLCFWGCSRQMGKKERALLRALTWDLRVMPGKAIQGGSQTTKTAVSLLIRLHKAKLVILRHFFYACFILAIPVFDRLICASTDGSLS